MNSFDRFSELWMDYLEGDLSHEGMAELQRIVESQPERVGIANEHYQIHRILGLISKTDSDAFIHSTVQRLPASSEEFVSQVVARIDSQSLLASNQRCKTRRIHLAWRSMALCSASVAALWLVFVNFGTRDQETAGPSKLSTEVKFSNTARSKFLGSYAPAIGSTAVVNREYILTSGLVQLQFPSGAEAILEGPAVFEVARENRLQVSIGRCSVYCPTGAEGFLVDTPSARVVDRGTRFFVNVAESSTTEVHVIDGAAHVYHRSEDRRPATKQTTKPDSLEENVRLTKHQALIFDNDSELLPKPTDFQPRLYQSRLPDRILSYTATQENGGAKDLISVQVQRNGVVINYSAEKLIGVKLVWFRMAEKIRDMRHLAGDSVLPPNRLELLSDLSLNTGAINPGGSIEPLNTNPLFAGSDIPDEQTTTGFAIEFIKPVVNCPGPDFLFFELQDLPGAPDGDAFHVMPLRFGSHRKALTVNSYDLTLTSPEVQRPANFYLHEFEQPMDSIEQLLTANSRVLPNPQGSSNYRIIAVAIDLSSMGFEEGESVEGLFFQDCLDNQQHVDPVAILGMPSTL